MRLRMGFIGSIRRLSSKEDREDFINQYFIVDDEPLIFHTGPRKMFPLVREAVASVIPVDQLRYVAFSHVEADECGSLNEWLAVAPRSVPLCGTVAAMVSITDLADRPPRSLADRDALAWQIFGAMV